MKSWVCNGTYFSHPVGVRLGTQTVAHEDDDSCHHPHDDQDEDVLRLEHDHTLDWFGFQLNSALRTRVVLVSYVDVPTRRQLCMMRLFPIHNKKAFQLDPFLFSSVSRLLLLLLLYTLRPGLSCSEVLTIMEPRAQPPLSTQPRGWSGLYVLDLPACLLASASKVQQQRGRAKKCQVQVVPIVGRFLAREVYA